MIVTGPQPVLRNWLCERIGADPQALPMQCFGRAVDGRLVGVVGLANWTDATAEIHVAGDGRWITRELIIASLGFAFAHVRVLLALIGCGNARSMRLAGRMGFREECRIAGAHADGALVVMSMRREECRFLEMKHGTQSSIAAAAA